MGGLKKWMAILLSGCIAVGSSSLFSSFIEAAPAGFKDVKSNHWAKSAIEAAVSKGYFKGYTDGTFKPGATVTRAEFAALLARVSKAESDGSTAAAFTDLSGHWSEAEVQRAVSLGFIDPSDYQQGFKPNTPITRFEMAKWMTSGLAKADPDYQQALEDTKTTVIPVREYFQPGIPETKSSYIAVAMGTKLLSGYPDGTFGMDKPASRAEASALLLNFESVNGKQADSFLGLRELRQVGTERTNVETISPFTTGNTSFNDVVGKTFTLKNHAGSLKLHNYIVVDTEDFKDIDSIYAPLFVDETDYRPVIDKPGTYRAFINITIYPTAKDFYSGHYSSGGRTGLANGIALLNERLMKKYGYLTLPVLESREYFAKYVNEGKGLTIWVNTWLVPEIRRGGGITTFDDGTFVEVVHK